MPKYRVIVIPNSKLYEDDSSDYKEWKEVEFKSANQALKELEKNYLVVDIERIQNIKKD